MDKELKVICGDAIEEMKKLPDNSVRLIVTDPPYNLNKNYGNNQDKLEFDEYLDFSRQWLREAARVLTDDGTIYVFMGMRYISYIYNILEQELGMTFNSWITWFYTQGIGKTKGFSPRHDDILMFTKDPKKFVFHLDDIREMCIRDRYNTLLVRRSKNLDFPVFSKVSLSNVSFQPTRISGDACRSRSRKNRHDYRQGYEPFRQKLS